MKPSTLKIDETQYSLVYDFNTIADAEPALGTNLLAGLENLGGGMTAAQIRGLFFALTRETHAELTLAEIGKLIRLDTIGPLVTAIGEACCLAVSDDYADQFRAAVQEPAPKDE